MSAPERLSRIAGLAAIWSALALVLLPLALSVAADLLLQANRCDFDLKNGTHCLIAGADWGAVLGSAFFWGRAIAFGLGLWICMIAAVVWGAPKVFSSLFPSLFEQVSRLRHDPKEPGQ